jgi:hypothetical protein
MGCNVPFAFDAAGAEVVMPNDVEDADAASGLDSICVFSAGASVAACAASGEQSQSDMPSATIPLADALLR